jgi:hypothetical protein
MDGPISTNESAGSAQQAGFVPVRTLSVDSPDKVPPVSEDSRSRSTARDEVGVPGKTYSASSGRDKPEQPVKEKTQEPAYFVEFPLPSGERESAAVRSDKQHLAEAEPEEGQEPLSLPGEPSQPKRYDDLSDLLEAAKRRWAEVNQESLEANALPGQSPEEAAEGNEEATAGLSPSAPDPSRYDTQEANREVIHEHRFSSSADRRSTTKPLNPNAPPGAPQDPMLGSAVRHQQATRYQSFAMALSNPHQTRPIVDLFV